MSKESIRKWSRKYANIVEWNQSIEMVLQTTQENTKVRAVLSLFFGRVNVMPTLLSLPHGLLSTYATAETEVVE